MQNLSAGVLQDLKHAIQGHAMEHGRPPDFILMTQDVYNRLCMEAHKTAPQSLSYGGTMTDIDGVEIGQLAGQDRVELVTCLLRYKTAKGVVS